MIFFSIIYIYHYCFSLHLFSPVDEDTEGSSRSGHESMSASDLIVGPGLNGNLSKDDRQKERKNPEMDKESDKDKDKNKAKKGVLKGLGEMFR